MATKRLATIPFEHIEAELAAFPISSEDSFCSQLFELDPVTCQQKNLWRAAEQHVLSSAPTVPLDEFVMIRDKLWFGETPELDEQKSKISLAGYLYRLVSCYLDEMGRPVERSAESTANTGTGATPNARLRWSWLCRTLPPDLLLTVRNTRGNFDSLNFPLSPTVATVLQEKSFAETHLHLGAAADFSLIWANFMHALSVEEVSERSLSSPGACFDNGNKLAKWVLWAATARLILAEWLLGCSKPRKTQLFDFIPSHARMDIGMRNDLHHLLLELVQGSESEPQVSFPRGRTLYRALIRPLPFVHNRKEEWQRLRARYEPKSRDEAMGNDPIARVVGWSPKSNICPETLFVRKALESINSSKHNSDFVRLFWQVVRVRCLLYQHLVQHSLTPGLQWFVRTFSRIKPVRGSLSNAVSMETAFHRSGGGKGLSSLEVRTGTSESESECRRIIEQVNSIKTRPNSVEVGVVFHFSRERGGGWRQGFPNAHGLDHSYPGVPPYQSLRKHQNVGNPNGYRFARFYLDQRRHAQALVSVLCGFPRALGTFRGIDLCTDEAGVPIWVMAPLVRWVRDSGKEAATQLLNLGIVDTPPLRTTVHAGEDFVHLLTGLRRLDDAIERLELEEGDRIGHGVALGLKPEIWFERAGRIIQTREERLLDLVWEWGCYATQGVDVESARLPYLAHSIDSLSRKMFEETYTPEDLLDFLNLLHNESELKALGFPNRSKHQVQRGDGKEKREGARFPDCSKRQIQRDSKNKSRKLLHKYLCDTQVWKKGRALETIVLDHTQMKHELKALQNLQGALRRKTGTKGLTIEVNPSSNLLVAGLGLFGEHPIWRLKPLEPADDIPPLSVCIGSDDPLTFATTLPQEYQLLFDTIVMQGQSHEVALSWLDDAREAGLRARFTLPRKITRCNSKLQPSLQQAHPAAFPP